MSDLKIDAFTVSYNFDTREYGQKSGNFLSVNFKLTDPVSIDEFEKVRIEASKKVSQWAIHDALMRGELSQSDAKERLTILMHNSEKAQESVDRRYTKEKA